MGAGEFTDEFKREAVTLWQTSGRLQTDVVRELGIQPLMRRRWQVRLRGSSRSTQVAARVGAASASAMPTAAAQTSEIARLRREQERTKMERDM